MLTEEVAVGALELLLEPENVAAAATPTKTRKATSKPPIATSTPRFPVAVRRAVDLNCGAVVVLEEGGATEGSDACGADGATESGGGAGGAAEAIGSGVDGDEALVTLGGSSRALNKGAVFGGS